MCHDLCFPHREHAMLAKTAGVKHLVVLINKMDDPTVNWSEERYVSSGAVEAPPPSPPLFIPYPSVT